MNTSMRLPNGLHVSTAGDCIRVHGCTSDGTYGCCYVQRATLAELTPEAGAAYIADVFAIVNEKPSKRVAVAPVHMEGQAGGHDRAAATRTMMTGARA